MSDAKRKSIEQTFYIDRYDLNGKLVDVVARLQGCINEYGESAEIEIEVKYGYYDEIDVNVEGRYFRDETDKEFNKRLVREEKARKRSKVQRAKEKVEKEEQERKNLTRLLKKYGEE